jgi:hypothetical protein
MPNRIQRAYQNVNDAGVLTVNIYGPPNSEGKQEVARKLDFDAASLPEKMSNICLAKGLGFYMAGRYATDEDPSVQDIVDACNDLYKEMSEGKFVPGRASGEGRPTPFFEALAEYLKQPVHLVMAQIREDKVKFSAGKLAQMAKFPAIQVITARIERERAVEKGNRARAAAKTAEPLDIAAMFDAPTVEVNETEAA